MKQITHVEENATVHIHPQEAWHFEARILMNRHGLVALREALATLGEDDTNGIALQVMASDGEGYDIEFTLLSDEAMAEARPYYRVLDESQED